MADDLKRIFAFAAQGDMGGERTVHSRYGTAVYSDRVPKRSDANYLRVEKPVPDARSLVEELRRVGRRMVWFPEGAAGDRLAPEFEQLGWQVDRHVIMAQRRPPEPVAARRDRSQDIQHPALRMVEGRVHCQERRHHRQGQLGRQGDAAPVERVGQRAAQQGQGVEQLFCGKELIAERVTMRCFAIVVDGEVASYADLYLRDGAAQIEDVGTLPEHRGRGYASAVILAAVEEALSAGAELVFLFADAEDWPKELYRRLGFDKLGHYVKFFQPR